MMEFSISAKGSVRRDPGVGLLDLKAAYSMSLTLTKSEFTRKGVITIPSAGMDDCFAGLTRMVCSWTWFLPHGRRSISMLSTFSKPCLR